ncbi:MAG TPA: hypothetical protein VG245_02230 [Candidatus Dormibacteraeota bacterium]|jgi:hypothetical protein|nr:hypothetical protein [Candidatus Dormibacteraeota bacterium]
MAHAEIPEDGETTSPTVRRRLVVADVDMALPGEEPDSDDAAAARRWQRSYQHLIDLQEEIIDMVQRRLMLMPAEARRELEEVELPNLLAQRDRLGRRQAFWRERFDDLSEPETG